MRIENYLFQIIHREKSFAIIYTGIINFAMPPYPSNKVKLCTIGSRLSPVPHCLDKRVLVGSIFMLSKEAGWTAIKYDSGPK